MSVEQPPSPEIERRDQSKLNATEQFSIRAQHVMADFFHDHPEDELRKMVEEKLIDHERAYRILVQRARDPLTGVQRRDILPYILKYEMYLRRDTQQPFTIGFYDIDNFKSINTDFDHSVGDAVLQRGAQIISRSARDTDDVMGREVDVDQPNENVARQGGEEFLVIYPNTTKQDALIPAERLRQSFSDQMSGVIPDGRTMTISGGLVEYDPDLHPDWEALIQAGSQTALAAKAAGRNQILTEIQRAA